MFEELLISVVLIILCIISNLYSKKEEEKETTKNNDTDWMNIFKKKEKINELNRLLIDELIEDIVIEKDNNLKIIFKCEDDDNLGEILSQAEMTCRKNKEFSDVAIIIDKSPGMIN